MEPHGFLTEPPGHGANRSTVGVLPGGLRDDVHPLYLEQGQSQYTLNCNTDRHTWKLDKRYRQFQQAGGGASCHGMGYGYYNGVEEIWIFQDTGAYVYDVDANPPHSTVGNSNSQLTSSTSWSSQTTDVVVWQAGRYLFAANTTFGIRFREIGTSASSVYGGGTAIPKPTVPTSGSGWTSNANIPIHVLAQPYKSMPFGTNSSSAATITVTGMGTVGVDHQVNRNQPGRIVVQRKLAALNQTKVTTTITFGGSITWGDNASRFIFLHCKGSSGTSAGDGCALLQATEDGASPISITLYKGANTHAEIRPVSWEFIGGNEYGMDNELVAMFEVGDVDIWKNAEVSKVDIVLYLHIGVDDEFYIFSPTMAGAPILRRPDGRESPGITLAWAYKVSGKYGPLCDPVTWNRPELFGVNPFANITSVNFPDGDSVVWFAPIIPDSLPTGVTSSDYVGVFRRIYNGRWVKQWESQISALTLTNWDVSGTTVYKYPKPSYTATQKVKRSEAEEVSYGLAETAWWSGDTQFQNYGSNAVAGCYWKNSNVISKTNGYVYFSRVHDPFDFYWSDISDIKVLDPNDPGQPRTIQVSSMESPIIAFVPRNALYMFSKREAFVMFGEYPYEASVPFKAAMSHGALGVRAVCGYRDGALCATERGLMFVRAIPASSKEGVDWQYEEVTSSVRNTYKDTLLGSDRADWPKVVVREHEGEIWIFCENRYLHFTRSQKWVYGEWADANDTIEDAFADPNRGLIFATDTGELMMVGDYATDGGTATNGTGGTAPTWACKTRKVPGPIQIHRARPRYDTNLTGTTIKVHTDRTSSPTGISITSDDYKSFEPTEALPGSWAYLEITGAAGDELCGLDIEVSGAHTGVV